MLRRTAARKFYFARYCSGGCSFHPDSCCGAPGVTATVPQWQSSKGFLIVTAALEPTTNQVTHFYSEKKNTDEIVKLIEMLLGRYRHLSCIYLSWDAASWHISKRLTEKIEAINVMAYVTGSPRIELVPLPASSIPQCDRIDFQRDGAGDHSR
jgi:hypothetical protein